MQAVLFVVNCVERRKREMEAGPETSAFVQFSGSLAERARASNANQQTTV